MYVQLLWAPVKGKHLIIVVPTIEAEENDKWIL